MNRSSPAPQNTLKESNKSVTTPRLANIGRLPVNANNRRRLRAFLCSDLCAVPDCVPTRAHWHVTAYAEGRDADQGTIVGWPGRDEKVTTSRSSGMTSWRSKGSNAGANGMVPFGRSPMFASQIRSVSVEIALQVFTDSVAAAKGALDLVQQRFRLVSLVRQLVHGGLALWFHGIA